MFDVIKIVNEWWFAIQYLVTNLLTICASNSMIHGELTYNGTTAGRLHKHSYFQYLHYFILSCVELKMPCVSCILLLITMIFSFYVVKFRYLARSLFDLFSQLKSQGQFSCKYGAQNSSMFTLWLQNRN